MQTDLLSAGAAGSEQGFVLQKKSSVTVLGSSKHFRSVQPTQSSGRAVKPWEAKGLMYYL